MDFYVTFRVDARFIAVVNADDVETALEEAEQRFFDADFGEAECIDGKAIIVEDQNGNFVWEQ